MRSTRRRTTRPSWPGWAARSTAPCARPTRGDVGAPGLVPRTTGRSSGRTRRREALLGAVPDDRMLVLDLWGDRSPGVEGARGVLRQAVDLERAVQLRRQGERERRPAADRRQPRQRHPEPGQGTHGRTRHDDGGAWHQSHRARLRDGPDLARQRPRCEHVDARLHRAPLRPVRTRRRGAPGSCCSPPRFARRRRPATSSPSGRSST